MTSVPVYFITNRALVNEEKYFNIIKEASKHENIKIILREKDLSDEEYKKLYCKVKKIVPNTEVIINSKLKVFNEVNEKTIQLSFKNFINLKNFNYNVGVSVHSIDEGILAAKKGAKYILASHIYQTKCKEGLEPKGISFIKALRKKVKCEIIALGGIDTDNFKEVMNSGADGVAVMSLLYKSDDIHNTIEKYKI